MNVRSSLPVESEVVLSYVIDQKLTSELVQLTPQKVIDRLKRQCPLIEYLFDHPEEVVKNLLEIWLHLPPKVDDLDRLAEELRTGTRGYLIHNLEAIMKRIPLSQICVISESTTADPNVRVLGEELSRQKRRDSRKQLGFAIAFSRQYTRALNSFAEKELLELVEMFGRITDMDPFENKRVDSFAGGKVYWHCSDRAIPNRDLKLGLAALETQKNLEAQLGFVKEIVEKYHLDFIAFLAIGRVRDVAFQRRLEKLIEGSQAVVLDEQALKEIVLDVKPGAALGRCLIRKLPPKQFSPYKFTGWVTGEIFFGREKDIRRILDTSANYCVVGSRRIGKSSLLKTVEHKINTGRELKNTVAVYVDATPDRQIENFQKNLYQQILNSPEGDKLIDADGSCWINPGRHFFSQLAPQLKKTGRHFVFLIDEIDQVLADDKNNGAHLFEEFARSISNEGYARFVLSGYRTLRARIQNKVSYLYNLFDPIQLGQFNEIEAEALVREPMEKLLVAFENEAVIDRILELGSRVPWLLQQMCDFLLTYLDDPRHERTITLELVEQVYQSSGFSSAMTSCVTESEDMEVLERIIVYLAVKAPDRQFDEFEMFEMVKNVVFSARLTNVRRALKNLTSTYIFVQKNFGYQFLLPQLRNKLKETTPHLDRIIQALAAEYREEDEMTYHE
jgi:hypothetical protein